MMNPRLIGTLGYIAFNSFPDSRWTATWRLLEMPYGSFNSFPDSSYNLPELGSESLGRLSIPFRIPVGTTRRISVLGREW